MAVERWTDGMLDELASSVSEIRDSVVEVRGSVTELRDSLTEVRDSIAEVRDSVDGLRVTVQALLQVASQSQRDTELLKQRQVENDQRFNILLEEVRYLIRGNQGDSNNS
ncbi:hypothetical protein [Nostoc sp. WHI]|uniref:hypothetical protein n=1 Tax=Nostoc sp. WHI TaxID=2650611 RepID=UPI0018C81840|nr:hypothetical protein [Nostoc sp. WHI]MBG1267004.1 hypothetical protein [Nostoc sp. WHI]